VQRITSEADAVAMREEPSPRQFAGEALMLGSCTATASTKRPSRLGGAGEPSPGRGLAGENGC
jgi:hypothetical protein